MREAHCHIAPYGQSLSLPRLDDCQSLAECLDRIRSQAALVPPGGWLRLTNARTEAWPERRWPTLDELDAAAGGDGTGTGGGRPCVIMSFDHHAAAANSAALRAAGLRAGEAVPPNGLVCIDEHSGRPTGLLVEQAAYRAWDAAPPPTAAERRLHVQQALHAFRDLGFTEVHDLHSQDWLGPLLADLEREGGLPVSVHLYPPLARLETDWHTRARWQSDRLRLAGGKLFADGTLNSRTALTLTDYADPFPGLPRGKAMLDPAEIERGVKLCESLSPDLSLAVHAIGDAAVRMTLDAIERASTRAPSAADARHRIEHCELIDEADVPRFAHLGVVCSVQPCHLLTDIEVLRRQFPSRLHRVLPLRELIEADCSPASGLLWFGSDAPIVRPDPADSVQAAVHRRRPSMHRADAIGIEQRIDDDAAWACFSYGACSWGAAARHRSAANPPPPGASP